jgi:Immunity protein 21
MIAQTTCSGGGPVIALPAEIAHLWRGTLSPVDAEVPEDWTWGDGDIICDYDLACDEAKDRVSFGYDVFGWLPVGESRALVFTAEQEITFIPEKAGGVISGNFDDLKSLESLIKTVQPGDWKLYSQTINLNDGRLFLFDSACKGEQEPEEIEADDDVVVAQLSPGTYKIFHYNTKNSIGLVRLEKQE